MFLFQLLELLVDDFNVWPTDVLFDIFINPPTIEAIERIASFAYGNGIPLRLLTHFLRLCNLEWSEVSFSHLYALYHMWKLEPSEVHRSQYYNVGHKRLCWLNGDDHNQDEFVLKGEAAAAVVGAPLGFDLSTHEAIIHKLNCLSHEEYVFEIMK